MTAQLIDGKRIAAEIHAEIAAEAARLLQEKGIRPGLAVILVGDDPASKVYVRSKGRACEELGFHSETIEMPAHSAQDQVAAQIERLNRDPSVHGVLLQIPVPAHLNAEALIHSISPEKDVDGLHPLNVGRLALGLPGFIPCTPQGAIELLLRSGINPKGKKAVIVGRSNLVGRPLAQLLSLKRHGGDATVCICHSRTPDIGAEARQADILVAATGQAAMIKADMVKPGAAVIDVGISQVKDPTKKSGYRLAGDVDFEAVKEVAGWITPVPGGVGPMTIAMLMRNTLWAAHRSLGACPTRLTAGT